MKSILLALSMVVPFAAMTQTVINQAIITTKTTMVVPDDFEMNPPPGSGEGGERRIMMFGDGGDDIKTTTWFKDDKVKVLSESGVGRHTTIYDKKNKRTTTLIEAMGMKRGFYSTAEDDAERKRKMDSLTGATGQKNKVVSTDVEYIDSTKKVTGYVCKKALIKSSRENGKTDTLEVWYTPEFKMGDGFTFGGGMGMTGSVSAFQKLNGYPMLYEVKTGRGIRMIFEVSKIDLKKEIDEKEFDVPKDFDLKPMKDMNGQGMMRMRF